MAPRAAAVRCLLCAAASGASADTASQGSPPSLGEWPYGATCGDRAARHDDSFDLLRIDPQADAGALQLDEASPSGSSVATPTPTPAPDSSTTSFPVPTTSLEAPTLAGWELVFRQTVPYTFGGDEWTVNSGDPLDDNFAILDRLESFRVNGSFTFMLRWPADGLMDQVWAQTSNPVTTAGHVTGYQPIDVPYSGQDWGGLRRSVVGTLLDGSNELSFWYALGTQYLSRDGFIPGPATNSSAGIFVSQVELWAKAAPNSAPAPTEAPTLAGWELVFRQTVPYTWGVDEWSVGSDPLDDNFAILDRLESFRINSATRRSGSSSELTINGSFTFMLRWPADGLKDQVWAQSSNPVTTAGNVTGYQPIDCPYTGQDWGGLRRSVLGALLDGSNEISFWYALGTQYLSRDGFIPGPATNGSSGIFVSQVELWTKAHHDNDAEQPDHETEVFVPEAGAKDDPHITNLAREEFAVNQPGDHTLLRVPADAWMPPLLEVSAAILPSGESKCGMYIRSIALSGEWLRGHTVQVRSLRRNKAGSNIAGNETLWPFAVRVSSGGLAAGGAWVPFESLGAGGLLAPSPSQAINSQLPDVFRISAFLKQEFGFLREAETFEFSIGRPGHTAQIHVSQASHQALNIELSAAKNLGTKRLAGLLGTEPHDHQVEVLTDGCKAERQLRRPRGIQDVLRLQAEALPVRKATVGTATW